MRHSQAAIEPRSATKAAKHRNRDAAGDSRTSHRTRVLEVDQHGAGVFESLRGGDETRRFRSGICAGDELHLLVGSETFLDLLSWHAPQRLPALARLVVVPRAGSAFDPEGSAAQKIVHTIGAEAIVRVEEGRVPARGTLLVHTLSLPLSASDIRERVRRGRSVAYRLPPEVIAYMEAHRLYRDLPR